MGMFWGAVLEPKIFQISKCKKIDYTETNPGISTSQLTGCTADKNYLQCFYAPPFIGLVLAFSEGF